MFDGIPRRWQPERRRPPDDGEPWPLHAVVTIIVLTIGVYLLKALVDA